MESGVFCCVNDSVAVSIYVALAGLDRRLLNKGCRRRRREKRSRLSISRLGKKKKETEKVDFSSLTSITVIPVFSVLDFF